MRRATDNPPAEPHDILVIHKPIRSMVRDRLGRRKTIDLTVGVLVDGVPLCIPQDSDITVELTAGGFTQVTVTLIAGTVDHARLPFPSKPKRERVPTARPAPG